MTAVAEDEGALVAALRAGDESAFAMLVERHTAAMLRIARGYVATREVAEDVVQETWIALLQGIGKFEGRSSLRTWLFTILINIAKERGIRDRKGVEVETKYAGAGDRWPGHWKQHEQPSPFPDTPEGSVLATELTTVARRGLDALPDRQRVVVTMRDMLGFDSQEVCDLLGISMANQRVLLHRGRAAVRQALEDYLRDAT